MISIGQFTHLSRNTTLLLCCSVVLFFAVIPLFFNFPFRDNIYLSWEGAYRISKGQVPFRDFGIPLGFAYWLIPGLFFKVLSPSLYTLIKAQVFINVISGMSFYYLARSFAKNNGVVFLSVFIFVISYSFYNFWPWYNHTVIVYEIISLALLFVAIDRVSMSKIRKYFFIGLSAVFGFLSFYTKQDAGALAIFISFTLIFIYVFHSKDWTSIVVYISVIAISCLIFILPFIEYNFFYWFNYGQPPHYSRVSLLDLIDAFFGESQFIKLYLVLILFLVIFKIKSKNPMGYQFVIRLVLVVSILLQASIHQVTSYVPADVNIYFHSFAILFLLYGISDLIDFSEFQVSIIVSISFLIFLSGRYWDYSSRIFTFLQSDVDDKNVVSSSSYTLNSDSTKLDVSKWKLSNVPLYEHIKLPEDNIEGINRLIKWKEDIHYQPVVLNMSEHTPLTAILNLNLSIGDPLWYHYQVSLFDKELDIFKQRIKEKQYDLVLFEYIPHLNNFYPFEIREELKKNYKKWFDMQAPRDDKSEIIEVYLKE